MYDPENKIVQLCAQGMSLEGEGKNDEAHQLFLQAWEESTNDFEKFTSAHYVARHQKSVADKLKWDEIALNLALGLKEKEVKGAYPSLYLNVAKGYEDLGELKQARKHYELALSFVDALADEGYGRMIREGIKSGMERVEKAIEKQSIKS